MWAFLFFAGLFSGWWGALSSVAPPAPILVPEKPASSEGTMIASRDAHLSPSRTLPFVLAIARRYEARATPGNHPSSRVHLEPYRASRDRISSSTRDDDHLESVRNLYRTYRLENEDDVGARFHRDYSPGSRFIGKHYSASLSEDVSTSQGASTRSFSSLNEKDDKRETNENDESTNPFDETYSSHDRFSTTKNHRREYRDEYHEEKEGGTSAGTSGTGSTSSEENEGDDVEEEISREVTRERDGITSLALYPSVDESDLASRAYHATTDAPTYSLSYSESTMERPRVSRAAVSQNQKNRNRTKANSRREQRRQGRNKERRGQNWCPEADVGNRAYRAPTVFEGKARSMSSARKPGSNYAVTFEVKQVYKSQPGFQPLLKNDSVRLHFRDKVPGKSTLCGGSSEAGGQDSQSGMVRANIKRGKVYLVFVDRVGPRNFTILYEPMIRSKKNAQAVQAVIRPDYVRAVTLSELRDAVAGLQDRVKLVCRTRGSPPPRVHWFKDDKPLHPRRGLRIQHKRRRSKVVIASARAEDSGEYKCVAESFSGNRAALAAELLVTHAPETTTAAWPRQEAPCPIKDDFCMNGGTCLFFETVGEPACRCAEGFTGLRCETKDVMSTGSVYNRHRAPFSCKLGLSTSYYC